MADSRFFRRAGPFTLGQIAAHANAQLSGGADPERLIHDIAPLDEAGADQVSFLDNKRYLPKLGGSQAPRKSATSKKAATKKAAPAKRTAKKAVRKTAK